jgi:polyhydroxyalkanoate synthesis repressor PhaR
MSTLPQVVIKRYKNRKLYDTKASSYTTLSGLVAMLRTGTDVQVVDAKSGEDLTGLILATALLDRRELFKDTESILALKKILTSGANLGTMIKSDSIQTEEVTNG